MKESIWRMRKSLVLTLALVFSIVTALATSASPIPITTPDPETMVYLDPATINGTVVGEEFNVSIMIRDAFEVYGWQAGLIFNPDLLECTESTSLNKTYEGDFLKSGGRPTWWIEGNISNTEGVIEAHSCLFLGNYNASGDGTLAYATFRVKASGVSDLHLRDVEVKNYYKQMVPINIIDVYTVNVTATFYKIVTVSNSTGLTTLPDPLTGGRIVVHSGFYGHAHNLTLKEISFNVTGPYPGFSKVAVPETLAVNETLLNASTIDKWRVIIDGKPVVTEDVTKNATHHLIYFTYSEGIHEVIVTTRPLGSSSISITATPTSVTVRSNITISGAIEPEKRNVTVYIEYRTSGTVDGWTEIETVQTDQNSNYSYTWTPATAGNYEVRARWEGDMDTESAESEYLPIEVLGKEEGIDPLIIAAAGVVVIIVVAVVVYFVKFRKPEEE